MKRGKRGKTASFFIMGAVARQEECRFPTILPASRSISLRPHLSFSLAHLWIVLLSSPPDPTPLFAPGSSSSLRPRILLLLLLRPPHSDVGSRDLILSLLVVYYLCNSIGCSTSKLTTHMYPSPLLTCIPSPPLPHPSYKPPP